MGLVNQAKKWQLTVMEITLNVCNHKHLSNNLDSFYETFCLFSNKCWLYYFSSCQCFTLMGPLTNKSHEVLYDANWGTKASEWYSQGEKQKYLVICHTMNFVQLVDPRRISHLNCPKCERMTVRVLRGKSTGDLATLCHWSWWLDPVGPALHRSLCHVYNIPAVGVNILPALPVALCPSYLSKYPPGPAPLCLPLAEHKPPAALWDQTARPSPWLRLSIGSYGNGRLSPYCLIG